MNDSFENTIFNDLVDLEKTLKEDQGGDRARALISYYEQVARNSESMLRTAQDASETRLIGQLIEGFQAAQRIVRHVWESLHQSALAV